ncbi:MAG: tetratricopeptide repeat protein [Desulfatibacillum sp.]|nr:tetratricopeptide repeat protein [Desulfatibacillum sp.]
MGTRKNRQCTKAFLISEAAPQVDHTEAKAAPESLPQDLAELFPNMVTGRDYIENCLQEVESQHAFGALAVKVDGLDAPPGENNQDDLIRKLKSVARVLEQTCTGHDLTWGLLEHGIFAVCLPEAGEMECRDTGRAIQAAVKDQGHVTATVGTAVFPTADFQRAEIFDNILKALDHAEFFGPDVLVAFDAVSLNISGDKLYHEKDVKGAIREFERALLVDSGDVNVHNSLGVCFAVFGDFHKALDRFDMAAQLDPAEIMPVYNAGVSYLMLGDREKALEFFFRAGKVEPDLYELLLETGKLLLVMDRTEEAFSYLEKATKASPESWSSHKYLGDCHMVMGRTAEAAKAYAKAVKCNPEEAESLSALAIAYSKMGENLDIALSFAAQSVERAPNNGLYQFRMASILEQRGELPKAARQYEKALELGYPCREFVIKAKEKLKQVQA